MTTDKTSQVVLAGDCREVMATMDENSVDAIVCDPPYELNFMGKEWDASGVAYDVRTWEEALRVAKPGAYLIAFGGARTHHRVACAIEDAGWELRDTIMWIYGSGFPKSKNGEWGGTALKPAHEPIILARKPLIGTVAANFAAHGTGGLSIDACRVGWPDGVAPEIGTPGWGGPAKTLSAAPGVTGETVERNPPSQLGRWPANVIHDGSEEVISAFPIAPGQQGHLKEQDHAVPAGSAFGQFGPKRAHTARGDAGSAARFFYAAKASTKDREAGLDGFELRPAGMVSNTSGQHMTRRDEGYERPKRANTHPTVKPTELMRYLCRLVTPQGGTILDPFCGSGSIGRGAAFEGFGFVGIELCDGTNERPDYISIARARIADAVRQAYAVTQPDIFKESA